MPSTATSILDGLSTSVAVKAPVKAVSSGNLTLSGEQTVGGVACVEGDRVLAKNQGTTTENGIYVVSTGSWTRAKDFDGRRDIVKGTLVPYEGSTNVLYRVTSANPVTIGTSAITFEAAIANLTQSDIGDLLNPQTDAESAIPVTPTDLSIPSHETVGVILPPRFSLSTAATAAVNLTALQASESLAAQLGGGVIEVGAGQFPLNGNVYTTNGTVIQGAGKAATIWEFAGTGVLFDLDQGASSVVRSGLRGCSGVSPNSNTKTFVRVRDGRQCVLEDLALNLGNWPGSASIGVHILGRDFFNIQNCDLECARPILISPNPNAGTLNVDMSVVRNVQLNTTEATGICVEVETGAELSNCRWESVNFAGGRDGFRFNDTTTTVASYQLSFINCRTEQTADVTPTGWSFDIQSTAQRIQDIYFESCHFDPLRHGVRVRNGDRITLKNSTFVGTGTALDITFAASTVLVLENVHIPAGATVTLTNARRLTGNPFATGTSAVPVNATYIYDDGYAADPVNLVSQKPQFFGDMRFFPWTQTMADDAQINLPVRAVDGMDSALVFVGAYGAVGPVQASAMVHFTPSGSNIVSSSGSVDDANTDGNLCILDGGSGALSIINRLGTSVKLSSFTFFAN